MHPPPMHAVPYMYEAPGPGGMSSSEVKDHPRPSVTIPTAGTGIDMNTPMQPVTTGAVDKFQQLPPMSSTTHIPPPKAEVVPNPALKKGKYDGLVREGECS